MRERSSFKNSRYCHDIMKVRGARILHSIRDVQENLGSDAANRGGYRRDRDLREILDGLGPSQNQHGTGLGGCAEAVRANLSAL